HLKSSAPAWRPENGPAVVLGAGGAARAIVVALLDAGGTQLRLVNPTPARLKAPSAPFRGRGEANRWQERGRAPYGAGLPLNSTTLGMNGQPALELDLGHLPRQAIVYDIVYVPLETPLLAAARKRGNAVVDGLGMLLHQAVPGFAAWFGITPKVSPELRDFVL